MSNLLSALGERTKRGHNSIYVAVLLIAVFLIGTSFSQIQIAQVDALAGTPVAVADTAIMYEDSGPVEINWIANDDMDDNASLDSFDNPSTNSGTVVDNGDGTFDYTPTTGFTGGDGFTYTICDDDTPVAECSTATVSVTVVATAACLTGFYQTLSGEINILDTTTTPASYVSVAADIGELNATGFNPNDGLIYGYSSNLDQVVSFDPNTGDFNNVFSHTEDDPFAGDMDSSNNLYYNRSSDTTLYVYNTVSDSRSTITLPTSHGAADFAYVPSTDLFYGMQSDGDDMVVIDPDASPSPTVTTISTSGAITSETGGFGATWVTGDTKLYAFNNNSGRIFSINTTTGASVLEATSAPNGSNDGMSCAAGTDPFDISAILDYGDAPDSYGTVLASSGASAVVNTSYRLGNFNEIDADGQASTNADADDLDDVGDDEDGAFIGVTPLDNQIIYEVEPNTVDIRVPLNNGVVSMWIDLNDDGDFSDAGEQVATDVAPTGGTASLPITIPSTTAVPFDTFARVRLAARTGGGETGLFSFGEVEDYDIMIYPSRPTITNDALADIPNGGDGSYTVTGVCTDDTDSIVVTISDGSNPDVVSTATTCSGGTFSRTLDVSSLDDGTLTVTSTIDDTYNDPVSDVDTTSKDTVVPTITQAVAANVTNANASSYPVSGVCTADTDSITVTLTDSDSPANTASSTTSCSGGTYSTTVNASGLIDGSVNVESEIDDGINTPVTDDEDVSKDTGLPTITQSAAGPITNANATSYPVSGVCTADTDSITVTLTDSDSPANTASNTTSCSSGTYATTVNASGLIDGSVNVESEVDDGVNAPVTDDEDVSKDVILPTVTNDTLANVTNANQSSYPVSGVCTANGDTVIVTISDGSNPDVVSGALTCTGGTYSTNLGVSSLDDGTLTVTSDITDAVGNAASDADPTTKDSVNPTITQAAAPDINESNYSSYPVSGTCTNDGDVIAVTLTDSDSPANTASNATSCSGGTYATTVNASGLIDGSVNVESEVDDGINAPVTDDEDITKDTGLPTITNDTPATVSAANMASYPVSGVCTADGDSITVTISDGTNPDVVDSGLSCSGGTFSATVDVSSLDDGSLTITSDIDDSSGNMASDIDPAAKDTVGPTIVLAPLPDVTSDNILTYPVTGTCSAIGDSINVDVSDGAATVSKSGACVDDGSGGGEYSIAPDISTLDPASLDVTATISDGVNPDASDTGTVTLPEDLDDDDTSSDEEQAGPNGGDGNNDGTPDYLQTDVTTKVNPVLGAYNTTEVAGDCDALSRVSYEVESNLLTQDEDYDYELGLHAFEAECGTTGGSVEVTQYWDQEYDTSGWIYRKYLTNEQRYIDFGDQVTYGTADVGGKTVTTVTFTIVDGGEFDADGVANGRIVDPVGPAQVGGLSDTGDGALQQIVIGASLMSVAIMVAFASRPARKPELV